MICISYRKVKTQSYIYNFVVISNYVCSFSLLVDL